MEVEILDGPGKGMIPCNNHQTPQAYQVGHLSAVGPEEVNGIQGPGNNVGGNMRKYSLLCFLVFLILESS